MQPLLGRDVNPITKQFNLEAQTDRQTEIETEVDLSLVKSIKSCKTLAHVNTLSA